MSETVRDAKHVRFDSRAERERIASSLLGVDVRDVPKSALAVVAVYLAARVGDCPDDLDRGAEFLWREWEILHAQGIIKAKCPAAGKPRMIL